MAVHGWDTTVAGGKDPAAAAAAATRLRVRASDKLRLAHPARPSVVPRTRRAVRAFFRGTGAGARACENVALAVSEAVANAVVHAYEGVHEPGIVEVEAWRDARGLHVVVRDRGAGLTRRCGRPGAGLGVPLIHEVAADVRWTSHADAGTEVTMTFRPE